MSRLVQWFVDNPIASNLLMVVIVLGGIASAFTLEKEVFPRVDANYIDTSMVYPGAGPREVEQQITVRIEEAIADVDGIKKITSNASLSYGSVTAEVVEGADALAVMNEIKSRVDAINTFPQSAERPVVNRRIFRAVLLYASLYGEVDERVLKEQAQLLRDGLALQDGVSTVRISGMKDDEVSIEITEANLRRFNLTFDQVAQAIRQSSLNLPAGTIKTDRGDVQIQTRSQAYTAEDFSKIAILTRVDGSRLLLGDIAQINDGFAEQDLQVLLNGKRGIEFEVFIADNPDLYSATKEAREYLEDARQYLPAGMNLEVTFEMKSIFDSRLELLSSNAISGLILVFIVLMLFLRPKLAIWVCVGIAVAFAGAIWLMPYVGISLSMTSMFAFLMVLGIVVDDAIIVGESIYTRNQEGLKGSVAAASGAKSVGKPVVFAILSTIIFFIPMLGMPSELASFTYPIAVVVILCLIFSLVESLLILPSHLRHLGEEKESNNVILKKLASVRHYLGNGLSNLATNYYKPALNKMLNNNAATIVSFIVVFAISVVIFQGLPKSFMPIVPSDFVMANVTLPEGSSFRDTQRIMHHMVNVAEDMRDDEKLTEINGGGNFLDQINAAANGNSFTVFVGMADEVSEKLSSQHIANRLRELVGPIPEAKQYSLDFTFGGSGPDILLNMNIPANDIATQQAATNDVVAALSAYPGVFNVRNSFDAGQVEIEIQLKPHAETLGITLQDIARQTRQGFYGEEVQRIPRAKEDVRVMLRYSREERGDVEQLNQMRIRTAQGVEVPLEEVADISLVPGFTSINRVDRRRNISITAEVENGIDAAEIIADLKAKNETNWKKTYTGFFLDVDGNLRTQEQSNQQLMVNVLMAFVAVYVIMAIAFRSYSQPLLVLTAIPFGFMGAVIGHKLLGHNISLMSQMGFLACAGVVINDNLVLLDRINQLRQQGKTVFDAVLNAGRDRFRAIILTSITTFIGLLPILFEQSVQAQFLIPMVISLSFGVMFATTVTLILVPSLYLMAHNISKKSKSNQSDNEDFSIGIEVEGIGVEVKL